MLLDGSVALATGDHLGGELGPWAALVARVGVEPLALALPFVLLGLGGLALALLAWRDPVRAARPVIAYGVATLWYAAVGTLLALLLVVLGLMTLRRAKA